MTAKLTQLLPAKRAEDALSAANAAYSVVCLEIQALRKENEALREENSALRATLTPAELCMPDLPDFPLPDAPARTPELLLRTPLTGPCQAECELAPKGPPTSPTDLMKAKLATAQAKVAELEDALAYQHAIEAEARGLRRDLIETQDKLTAERAAHLETQRALVGIEDAGDDLYSEASGSVVRQWSRVTSKHASTSAAARAAVEQAQKEVQP